MRTPPSPGPMLLSASSRCDCGWMGVAGDLVGAVLLWQEHAQRAGHETHTHTEGE